MKSTLPELRLETLLSALERELLHASDEEILGVANELGLKPAMKGSIALLGVTFAVRMGDRGTDRGGRSKEAAGRVRALRSVRRLKGDPPS